jgi:acetyl-CoA C-acetyltransferase
MITQQPVWLLGGHQGDFARNFTKASLEISDLVKETNSGTSAQAGRASTEPRPTT